MKILKALINPTSVILFAILLRLLPHAPNFAPIGAMALFGGAYISKKYSIVTIIVAMLVSDYLLLYFNPFSPHPYQFNKIYPLTAFYHSTTLFIYGAFIVNILIGWLIAKYKNAGTIVAGSLVASIQFFLVTNFAVWAMGAYSRGIDGLMQSYTMGLPFFKYTALGDLFYSALFFGAYELAILKIHKKAAVIVNK